MTVKEWFSKEQLTLLSQPTMQRIASLLEEGDFSTSLKLAKNYKMEWSFLRKLMVDSNIAILEYIKEKSSEKRVEALKELVSKVWQPTLFSINEDIRKKVSVEIINRWESMGVNIQDEEFIHHLNRELLYELTLPKKNEALMAYLEKEDIRNAEEICKEVDHEWGLFHDILVESVALQLTFIGEHFGEEEVGKALKEMTEKGWKAPFEQINSRDRKSIVLALAATWRAHSTGGVGPEAGSFTVSEDDEKFTFQLHPCGSGQRLVKRGYYDEPKKLATTEKAYDWSFQREDFPYYCTHCTYMNEILPIEWSGAPVYPLDPPKDFNDPCTWYYYKNPADTPKRFYERYGFDKEEMQKRAKLKGEV